MEQEMISRFQIRAAGIDENREKLKGLVHIVVEDIAILFIYNGEVLTREQLSLWKMSSGELQRSVMKDLPHRYPAVLLSLEEAVNRLETGKGIVEPGETKEEQSYVLTNRGARYGAAVIFYPGVLEKAGEQLHSSFFILPSSIHEVILLKDEGEFDADELQEMVSSINSTEVAEEDILTDSVYYYDILSKRFSRVS